MSSTRSAGLRVVAWLCLSVLTLPRGAGAQKCADPSFQVPGFTESSGGVEPRDGTASVGTPTFDVINRVIYVGTEDGVIRAIAYPFP